MYKYHVAICEDEEVQLQQTMSWFRKIEAEHQVHFHIDPFNSGEALIQHGYEMYDVIILDVQMKEINGIDTAKYIRKTNKRTKIIFLTAIEQYWPEGFHVNAYRYLIKPIDSNKFCEEIVSILAEMKEDDNFIVIKHEGALVKVHISDIRYLEIAERKVKLHTRKGIYTSNESLGSWYERLQAHGFAHPHNSFLVNMQYIIAIDKEKTMLTDGQIIYVSQRKYKAFKEQFTRFVGMI